MNDVLRSKRASFWRLVLWFIEPLLCLLEERKARQYEAFRRSMEPEQISEMATKESL